MTTPFQKARVEIMSAMSSLNMGEEIIPGQENETYLADKYFYAHHSREHMDNAIDAVGEAEKLYEHLHSMSWQELVKYFSDLSNQEAKESALMRLKRKFRSFKSRMFAWLLSFVEIFDCLIEIFTFHYYSPGLHLRILFSLPDDPLER